MSATEKTQKVSFNVTIEVDPAMWDLAYGTGTSAKQIRDDVRSHFVYVIRDGGAGDGAILGVTERY